ncbi:MAG: PEP-CTERM sorting domain-containing protein [Verrucomicrobiaceae bacterium]|nr:MAG: PEP-CTERM sorting domain-containing protein [Verrucomicrobiaceae bacterium]
MGTYTLFDTNSDILGTLGTNLTGSFEGLNMTLGFAGGANGRNDLVLTVVPEPSAALSILIGAGAVLGMRRRRKSAA